MIATGGLLRINARRQDSLKSKPRKAHAQKKKSKNKRRNEVVVVKGKVKLCSVPGLVAMLGVLVLLGGIFMAALGYWPRDGLLFSAPPQEGTAMSSRSTAPPPADAQAAEKTGELEGDWAINGGDEGMDDGGFNRTETVNGTNWQLPRGFLEDFLDRYLYSDRLKVFGPLIMGIGIFLFICANAVLHENRDQKTKVINLRDIYSTVIDLHSLKKPRPPSANPLNGLINYVQSMSLETRSRAFPTSLLSKREGGDRGGGLLARQPESSRAGGADGDEVFSIFQQTDAPLPPPSSSSSSDRRSLRRSFSPPRWPPQQKEALCSFTLPLRRPRPASPHRRHSIWGAAGRGEELRRRSPPPPPGASTPPPSASSQARLLLSFSSLTPSHLSSSIPLPPRRRRSLPAAIVAAGYSKLTHGEEDSFDWSSSQGGALSSEEVTSQRRCSDGEV